MSQASPELSEARLVSDPGRLASALQAVDAPVVGLDVERDDSGRYFSHAALIQVGTAEACVLVDPLAIDELGILDEFLTERTTVLHSLQNDLAPLASAGVALRTGTAAGRRRRVEDTQVAAAMLGLPTGLSTLLEDELGVPLPVDADRYQRAAWEQRPLTEGMRRYAAADAVHLPRLWELLVDRLEEAERSAWYGQELHTTIEAARTDTRSWARGTGAGRLEPDQRAVLKALWDERETLAREHDIAPNVLLRDETLQSLARDPARDPAELVERDSRRGELAEHADRLLAAQERGRRAAPIPRTPGPSRSRRDREVHDALRQVRNRTARRLELDPGVLCPNRQLWRALEERPASPDELAAGAQLQPWQADLLAAQLWEAYCRQRGSAADG